MTYTLAQMVGETAENIAQAEAKRAMFWTVIVDVKGMDHAKQRFAQLNGAAWWLRGVRDTPDVEYVEYLLDRCEFGTPKGAKLSPDWFSPESAAARKAAAEEAAMIAKFTGLPTLKGSTKQVAWALSIRDKFREYCEDCMMSDHFEKIAKSNDAKKAVFWIDRRADADFKHLLEAAHAAS